MTKEEAQKKLVDEMTQLVEQVKKADLPTDLSLEIKKACTNVINGKDTDKLAIAFLILAFEVKMFELKDNTDRNAIDSLCKLMKMKAALTFDTLGAAMLINSIMKDVE